MRHFELEIEDLRTRLLEMGGLVESAIRDSVVSLLEQDEARANGVLANEELIDRMEIEIDDHAVRLLALYQPTACDMRFLAAAIKINNDLERMGDMAVEIARRALSLMHQPAIGLRADIPQLARLSTDMVHGTLVALVSKDAELARRILLSDDAVDQLRDAIYGRVIGSMEKESVPVPPALDLLFTARCLERIADHATNIAEDVLYCLQGVDVRHHVAVAQ